MIHMQVKRRSRRCSRGLILTALPLSGQGRDVMMICLDPELCSALLRVYKVRKVRRLPARGARFANPPLHTPISSLFDEAGP